MRGQESDMNEDATALYSQLGRDRLQVQEADNR